MAITVRTNKILIYANEEAERLQNREILPEHLLLGILRLREGHAYSMLIQAGLSHEESKQQLDQALALKADNSTYTHTRSNIVDKIMRIAESEARSYGAEAIGSAHLLLAILREHINRAAVYLESQWNITYQTIEILYPKPQQLPHNANISGTDMEERNEKKIEDTPKNKSSKQTTSTPTLDKYGHDLTKQAQENNLDPIIGRDKQIERVMQILARRKKNNPILIGAPGVGKSAIVEGLALRIIKEGSNEPLHSKRIISLDIASMVAGTTYRGQFEERMKNIIQELRTHPEIILFIDEIHTIIGAGNAQGTLDAAGILKPALSRGEVQCIGATTISEYHVSIEKDGALERRFQKVMVEPTTEEETLQILNHISERYGLYHNVIYQDEAIKASVALANRYITERAFPDKAIDIIDEAGARKHSIKENTEAQYVTTEDISEVVSMISGVPIQKVKLTENERIKTMADRLMQRVIGQDDAIKTVVKAIQRSRLGLHDPKRPIGTFFFLGPTGVGKTYLAQCLAEEMFGNRDALIRFDMSEYMEKHTVSLLVGAPPGYIAHEEGGKLTEAIRRKPYSILLFDEIEKAHPDIFNIFLQIMDEGRLTDRQGHQVDFRNTIIVLTSNVGTRQINEFGTGIGFADDKKEYHTNQHALIKALEKTFPPEFINRIDSVITFKALEEEALQKILDIELNALKDRLKEQGYSLRISNMVKKQLLNKSNSYKYGARPIRRSVQTYIEDIITDKMLSNPQHKYLTISNI